MLHCRWTHPADIRKAGYRHVLLALEDHFRAHRFLMGARPGASDFPICGQLTQLVHVDPTSMALAAEIAPRVGAWVLTMEDLWGLEPTDVDWLDATRLPDSLTCTAA